MTVSRFYLIAYFEQRVRRKASVKGRVCALVSETDGTAAHSKQISLDGEKILMGLISSLKA